MAYLDSVQSRPSSWPIRRERRHFAVVTAHAVTNEKLDLIMERLERMERAYGPPGLNQGKMADELVEQYRVMNAKIDTILKMLQSSFDNAMDFTTGATNQAPPFLTWCGARLCQEALCVPQFAADLANRTHEESNITEAGRSDVGKDRTEPEKEQSPHKGVEQEEAQKDDNEGMVVKLFDLFEGERMDRTTQTVNHERHDEDDGKDDREEDNQEKDEDEDKMADLHDVEETERADAARVEIEDEDEHDDQYPDMEDEDGVRNNDEKMTSMSNLNKQAVLQQTGTLLFLSHVGALIVEVALLQNSAVLLQSGLCKVAQPTVYVFTCGARS